MNLEAVKGLGFRGSGGHNLYFKVGLHLYLIPHETPNINPKRSPHRFTLQGFGLRRRDGARGTLDNWAISTSPHGVMITVNL